MNIKEYVGHYYEKKVDMFLPIDERKRKKMLKEKIISLEIEYEKKENELHKIKERWVKLVWYYLRN